MPPDWLRERWTSAKSWQRLAVALWTILIVAVCVRGAVQQRIHSLYPTYAAAGKHWLAGTSLYRWPPAEPGLDAYRYSPFFAIALVPFGVLPDAAGSVAWRVLNAGVLLAGLAAWLRSPLPWAISDRHRAIVFLLVLPLAATSLNNGQANPLVIGFLLLTVAAVGSGEWNGAAACTAMATALKVYPLTMGLLLAAVYPRRFTWRLAAALVVVAVLPFLFQRPAYVSGQYAEWWKLIGDDDRRSWPLHMAYRDLWLLFRVTGLPVGVRAYELIQVLSGVVCAAVCVAGRLRGWPAEHALAAVFTLGTCWMILCGPATESSTYVVLAPAFALALVTALDGSWPRPVRWLTVVAAVSLSTGSLAGLTRWTSYIHSRGVQPLAALLIFVAYLSVYVGWLRRGEVGAIPKSVAGNPARAA